MPCPPLIALPYAQHCGPLLTVIMDGVGIGKGDEGDAVACARTPNLDRYAQTSLSTRLSAHGFAVGMPSDDDMGNSEVGHNAMGAGRVFDQGAKLVNQAIDSGAVFIGPVWQKLLQRCVQQQRTLHFIGLLSDGNIHSHIAHLCAMISRADTQGVQKVCVHALLDGRDVARTSAEEYVHRLETLLTQINTKPQRDYCIASGGGRMVVTMDRYEADWSMVERGWRTHVEGRTAATGGDPSAPQAHSSAMAAIAAMRQDHPGIGDQDLPPFVIVRDGKPVGPVRDGDAVIAFNFRGDRMMELVRAFEDEDFHKFVRPQKPEVLFAGMTLYDGDTQRPRQYLVAPPQIDCTVSELLCGAGVRQLAVSETQKFGHVTYFWNGNRSEAFDKRLESYIEIPSRLPPFDAAPQMRAPEIAAKIIEKLSGDNFRFLRINLPNGDMVGHTGHFAATVAAMEAVDFCLGNLERAILAHGGTMLVTADHGNAEDMAEREKLTGRPRYDANKQMIRKTSHSLNPVPLHIIVPPSKRAMWTLANIPRPGLANLAATICTLLGYAPPDIYAPSLISPAASSI